MALTPLTLPEGTPYPGSVQDLLELFAAYLSAPTAVKALYVQSTAPTGVPEGTGWLNSVTKTLSIWGTVSPATSPAWVAAAVADDSVTVDKLDDGAVTMAKLDPTIQTLINSFTAGGGSSVLRLQETDTGLGSMRANFFIMVDGSLRCTGYNSTTGKNGYGAKPSGDNAALPKRCGFKPPLATSKVSKVYPTTHSTFVLTDAGEVYAAGLATNGQLGLGTSTDRFIFERIPPAYFGVGNAVTKLVVPGGVGEHVGCFALTENGTVYAWGLNSFGHLGLGTFGTPNVADQPTPVVVSSLVGLLKIDGVTADPVVDIITVGIGTAAGTIKVSSYALTEEGHVYACGWNGFEQLGNADGNTTARSYFSKMPLLTTSNTLVVTKMVTAGGGPAFYATAAFLMSDGTVRTVGSGTRGQLGNNAILNRGVPQTVQVSGGATLGAGSIVTKLYGFDSTFVAVCDDGSAYGWGYGADGVLGQNNTTNQPQAVLLPVTNVRSVALGGNNGNPSMVIVKDDGTMWGAGHNLNGQLGLGHVTTQVKVHEQLLVDALTVQEVVFGANWDAGTTGRSALLIRLEAGQVLACGWDSDGVGQLGVDASPWPVSVPTYVIF
jgi:alpha-tubulin suppressor-like RCC1 family protein